MYKIAVINSDESYREYLRANLSDEYDVEAFCTLDSVFDNEKNLLSFDLVITDLDEKDSTQRQALGKFSSNDIPVIVTVDDVPDEDKTSLLKSLKFDYLRKPFNEYLLNHRVALHLSLRAEKHRVGSMQDQLIQSEKMAALGQLAAGVAHEINNPIGFVSSNANLVSKYVDKLATALKDLETQCQAEPSGTAVLLHASWNAQNNISKILTDLQEVAVESLDGLNRVKEIVKDLKEYAHVGEPKFEDADINKLLTSTVNLLRNEIKYKAEVRYELVELPLVPCIISQINQVFVNIVINACHAIDDFGEILLKTFEDGSHIFIEFTDNGCGMPKEVARKIFDPFFTTKEIGKGTGIGLAITKSIVERHNADLSVKSEVGKGTTFTLKLPKVQLESDNLAT